MRGHLQQRGWESWRLQDFVGRSGDGKSRYVERTFGGAKAMPSVRWRGSSWRSMTFGTKRLLLGRQGFGQTIQTLLQSLGDEDFVQPRT